MSSTSKRGKAKSTRAAATFQASMPPSMFQATRKECGHRYQVCQSVAEYQNATELPCPVCEPNFDFTQHKIVRMQMSMDGKTYQQALLCVACHDEVHHGFPILEGPPVAKESGQPPSSIYIPGEADAIETFFNCAVCLEELPRNTSPSEYASLNVGFSKVGVQVWCTRHNKQVLHVRCETPPAFCSGHHH